MARGGAVRIVTMMRLDSENGFIEATGYSLRTISNALEKSALHAACTPLKTHTLRYRLPGQMFTIYITAIILHLGPSL